MKITYELTQREKDFLQALKDKEYPKYGYWGERGDDQFQKDWKEEIEIFGDNELFESVDRGPYSYWQRILNDRGMALYEFLTSSNPQPNSGMKTREEIYEEYGCSKRRDILDAMEAYAAQFQPRWIKINSEADLPEEYGQYITCLQNRRVQSSDYYPQSSRWITGGDARRNPVTHYMPLPQPPKED